MHHVASVSIFHFSVSEKGEDFYLLKDIVSVSESYIVKRKQEKERKETSLKDSSNLLFCFAKKKKIFRQRFIFPLT